MCGGFNVHCVRTSRAWLCSNGAGDDRGIAVEPPGHTMRDMSTCKPVSGLYSPTPMGNSEVSVSALPGMYPIPKSGRRSPSGVRAICGPVPGAFRDM